jgi:hypothetical protein
MEDHMPLPLGRRTIAAWAAVLVTALGFSIAYLGARPLPDLTPDQSSQEPDDSPEFEGFSADVSIRQAHVAADGSLIRTPPKVQFRIERSLKGSEWNTVVTLQGFDHPLVRWNTGLKHLENPFLISRMEYDEDGAEPRFYNRRGDEVRGPNKSDRRLLDVQAPPPAHVLDWDGIARRVPKGPASKTANDWIENVVATPANRAKRQEALERRLGTPQGQHGGSDRYVSMEGDETHEILVHPEAVVPFEMTVARGGTPVRRTRFEYDMRPGGVLVRRLLRTEQVLADAGGLRALTDIEVTNVEVTARGGK